MLTREDFKEEGQHRWVAYHEGYSVIVQQIDGAYEVTIRAMVQHDPTSQTWAEALVDIQSFFSKLRVADWYTGGGKDDPS